MSSNIDILGEFIPSVIQKSCIFLSYTFKRLFAWYIYCIDIFQSICKFYNKFPFFLNISDNSSLLILDKFLYQLLKEHDPMDIKILVE